VFYRTTVAPGSIVVDREKRFLYLIDSNNSARRMDRDCAGMSERGSLSRITNKFEWPDWRPSRADNAKDAGTCSAGLAVLVIHWGRARSCWTTQADHSRNELAKTIGHLVASGCIRL